MSHLFEEAQHHEHRSGFDIMARDKIDKIPARAALIREPVD